MASLWIKMRVDLHDDPAVISIASSLGMEEDTVIGKLHRLWGWADRHTVDGHVKGVTEGWVDRYLNSEGFASAMREAGWLEISPSGITFPKFTRHNGPAAKTRALTMTEPSKETDGVPTILPAVLPGNRPDLYQAAREVCRHFDRVVATKNRSHAITEVTTLLASGKTTDDLKMCADRYAKHCANNSQPADKRSSARSFYAQDGNWLAWLEPDAPEPMPMPKASTSSLAGLPYTRDSMSIKERLARMAAKAETIAQDGRSPAEQAKSSGENGGTP